MTMRNITFQVSEEDERRLDRLVAAWLEQRRQTRLPPSQRLPMNRSTALRDLLFAWDEGWEMPKRKNGKR